MTKVVRVVKMVCYVTLRYAMLCFAMLVECTTTRECILALSNCESSQV